MSSDENYRRHERIREEASIHWRIEKSNLTGDALIRDISVSGVLLEVSEVAKLDKGLVFLLQAAHGQDAMIIPDRARLVWFRAMKMEPGKYLCGLEFINPSDSAVSRIAQRVESWFAHLGETGDVNILKNLMNRDRR